MIRQAATAAFLIAVSPQLVSAQDAVLTVTAPSANVHKAPSTGSPVLGHVQHGATLGVTRELGSWVRIPWTGTPDGSAYVHVSFGTVSHPAAASAQPQAGATESPRSARVESRLSTPQPTSYRGGSAVALEQPVARPVFITPSTHILGVGGRMSGAALGYGGSARRWQRHQVGVQLEVTRAALTGASASGRVTALHIEPGILYSLPDRVTDSVWLRPYVGSGLNITRQTFSSATPGLSPSIADTSAGLRVFGGSELTFAGAPHIAVGVEAGYHRAANPFPGIDAGGLGLALSAHWYAK